MTEPQNVQASPEPPAPPQPPTELTRRFTVGDRSWVIEQRPDGQSWDLFASSATEDGDGPLIGRITRSERGYYCTGGSGVERGPYPTLDEAAYPLGAGEPLLLGPAVDGGGGAASASPRIGTAAARARIRRARSVLLVALVAASALVVVVRRQVERSADRASDRS